MTKRVCGQPRSRFRFAQKRAIIYLANQVDLPLFGLRGQRAEAKNISAGYPVFQRRASTHRHRRSVDRPIAGKRLTFAEVTRKVGAAEAF